MRSRIARASLARPGWARPGRARRTDAAVPARAGLQAKLEVSSPGDPYEREADRIAEQVIAMPAPLEAGGYLSRAITPLVQREEMPEEEEEPLQAKAEGYELQRQAEDEEEEEEEPIQTKAAAEGREIQRQAEEEEEEEPVQAKEAGTRGPARRVDAAFESAVAQEQAGGEAIEAATRRFFERRFGVDFGAVRVHDNAAAAGLARDAGARAFTLRNHVFFGPGQYDPKSGEGRRLLAHELTHTVQQGAAPRPASEGPATPGADARFGGAPGTTVQRAPPPAPVQPSQITFNFTEPVHTPHCGAGALRATTDGNPNTWSLAAGTAAVDAGTTISAAGVITIGAAQAAGTIDVTATGSSSTFTRPFTIASHPTGITSTREDSGPSAGNYGAFFEHVFVSNDGNVASLENVGVGEKFPGIPSPNAASHAITAPTWPFGGTFTLHTATLTPTATNNWFLTAAGELGGTHDSVQTGQAGINVGRFVSSASNPTPPQGLPATMTIDQHLHWFCPQKPAASRWTDFVTLAHSRTLRNTSGTIEFVTTVNGLEHADSYVGPTAVTNLNASPVSTPRSAGAPPGGGAAPAARTVALSVDTLPDPVPAGQTLTWTFVGAALGCTVAPDPADTTQATLTVGTSAGTVTLQAADSTGANRARVSVRIT